VPRPAHHGVLTPQPDSSMSQVADGLAQLTFVVQGALTEIASAHNLSIAQTRLLGILRDYNPTISELAFYLRLDKSSVTGLVDRAQERGLVSRVPSTTDGRSVHVTISAAGRRLADRGTAEFHRVVTDLTSTFNAPQRAALLAAAGMIVEADARRRDVADV
jgi:MarR family transcriptional regulator, lower aerobic nicotinate degradation pathway regulator